MTQVILTTKNGTTYVYESTSYYDKEKKQSRPLRKLIGKIDPKTGEVVPTGKRGRPATGRIRNVQVSAQVTEDERDIIKKYASSNNMTIAELLLMAVEKNKKKFIKNVDT